MSSTKTKQLPFILDVALDYHKRGWNVIPVKGKASMSSWEKWQSERMDVGDINRLESYWNEATGIAVICGAVSGNLLIIDLDGQEAVDLFFKNFPALSKTYTVKTSRGLHLYFYQYRRFLPTDKATHSFKVGEGEIALRVQNCYCVAPPSIHPDGGQYEVQFNWKVRRISTLDSVLYWMEKQKSAEHEEETKSPDLPAAKSPASSSPKLDQKSKDEKWALTALDSEVNRVRAAGIGERNEVLYDASLKLGSIIASNLLDRSEVEQMLMSASASNGLLKSDGQAQVKKTIASGIDTGLKNPRQPSPSKKNGNVTKAIEQSTRTKPVIEDKKYIVKPSEPHTKGHKPTDDELGDEMIAEFDGNYTFFFGAWNEYAKGVWTMTPRFKRFIWKNLIRNKYLGIRPTDSKAVSIEKYLQMELFVDDNEIDASMDYINLKNGLYNLKTGKLEDHRRDLYMTSQLPFSFDAKAKCPTFIKFLEQVLVNADGKTDKDLIKVIQQAFGYSLTADTSLRTSFWLVGASGTGKSTLLNVLIELAGNSHVAIDLDEMQRTSYQLADIAGKRIVTFTEPDSNSVLADGQYKRLVSQDTITARQAYGKPFRFVPIAKIWGGMNDTPRLVDRSEAIYGRVMIIPMNKVIPRDKWDIQLINKIRAELPGVFNWAIEGLISLRQTRKFHRSEQVENAREEYKAENDLEATFIGDWCECGKQFKISGQQLYDAYNTWCKRNGAFPKSSTKVSKDWKRLGFIRQRSGGRTFYSGIRLNEDGQKYA